ncbi:MAG: Mur ligase family protein [Thermomicrobiales bacterium]
METATSRPAARRLPPGALPIVAVGGRWGKTTVARLLEAMLRDTSPRLALWLDQGVLVNRRKLSGELIPWGEALRSLAAGDLDLAIQELDAHTVAAVGLPTAAYRLGVITSFCGNDAACLADERSRIERQAQHRVVGAIHPEGALVLNADDHAVAAEGDLAAGEVIYYALSRRNPIVRQHLAAHQRAVSISSGMIVLCEGRSSQPILPLRDVAIACGGALVFQMQNVLAATAAAWRLGVPPDRIAAALASFTSQPHLMRGACNQFAINGATVIVDRFHDAVSARSLLRGLRKISGRRRRQVILPASFGFPDDTVEEIGRLVGQSFDRVILHQTPGVRQADDALPGALRRGIAHNRFPPLTVNVPDEDAALDRLLQGLAPNDLGLVLATDLTMVLRALMSHRSDGPRDGIAASL